MVLLIEKELRALANQEKAAFFPRFFKTGPGQYGEGDRFLGVTVPQVRAMVKKYAKELEFAHIEAMLENPIHEVRLAGLLTLVARTERETLEHQMEIAEFYLAHLQGVNNWDLVDASAYQILGPVLLAKKKSVAFLERMAKAGGLWEQRIAIVATFAFIRKNILEPTLKIATILLFHPHDLIQKAVGWMLREVGKRDASVLREFLDEHAAVMPRTMLRYALEKFSPAERRRYMSLRAKRRA